MDVVPDPVEMPLEMADAAATAKEIRQMLFDAAPLTWDLSRLALPSCDRVTSKATLTSLGLKLGDRVVIAGQKVQLSRVPCPGGGGMLCHCGLWSSVTLS